MRMSAFFPAKQKFSSNRYFPMNSFLGYCWRWLLAGVVVSSMGAVAQAQTQAINLYSLMGQAEANYPQLRQRQAELAFFKAHEITTRSLALPRLGIADQPDWGTVNSLSGAYFPLGIIPSVSGGSSGSNKSIQSQGNIAIANVACDIYGFGYYKALQNQARMGTEISNSLLSADRYELRQEVVLFYIDWLRKYRLLQIRLEDMQRDSIVFSLIRANVLSGLRPGADSSTALATYAGARISYMSAGNDYDLVMDQLAGIAGITLGAGPDTTMTGKNTLVKLAALATFNGIASNHPVLDVFVKKAEAQRVANLADEKRFLPKLQLSAAYWARNTGVSPTGQIADAGSLSMPYSATNYLIGLTAAVNITDLKLRQDHKRENKFLADAGDEALKSAQLQLNTLYVQSQTSMQSTARQLEELPVLQHAASMAFQQQLALYRAGLNTLTDVTNAEYTLLQAETNMVVTQTEMLKLAYLVAALDGNQDLFIEQFKH